MDTHRDTTALQSSAAKSPHCRGLGPDPRLNPNRSAHLWQASVRKSTSPKKAKTFKEILAEVRPSNICRLKNRAFVANEVAKAAIGKSRRICYCLKSKTINELVKLGVASLCTIALSIQEPLIGVTFIGGGKLHTLPSQLDAEARAILQEQLIFAINKGRSRATEAA